MRYLFTLLMILIGSTAWAQLDFSLTHEIEVKKGKVTTLAFSHDGRQLAYGTTKGDIRIVDVTTGTVADSLVGHKRAVTALLFDSDDSWLVSAAQDNKLLVWDMASGAVEKEISGFKGVATSLAISNDGKTLAVAGSKSKEISLFGFPSGFERGRLKGHKKGVLFVTFGPESGELMSVAGDNKMIFWDHNQMSSRRQTEVTVQTMRNSGSDITAATCSEDRQIIAVAVQERVLAKGAGKMLFERSVAFYDWTTGAQIKIMTGNRKDMEFVTFTPDRGFVITDNSSLKEYQLSFWDTKSWVIEKNLFLNGPIDATAVSLDGNTMAVSYTDEEGGKSDHVTLWELSGVDGYGYFAGDNLPAERLDGFGREITLSDRTPLLASGAPRPLAVLQLDNLGVADVTAKSTTELLETELSKSRYVRLIERTRIEEILAELELQQSRLTESQSVEIGKLAEAELVLLGSMNRLGTDLVITARLVHVKSGVVTGIRQVTCTHASQRDIADMLRHLAPTIAAE